MKIKNCKFKIVGMHCTSCAMNIDFALDDIEGIKKAQTNYARQECEVEFDEEQVGITQIVNQIKKTGYQAEVS